jgi:endonuclease/exonuclease/phosphatase (EEP) superfamily protein YafD
VPLQLRILTANLWNGRAEPQALAEVIAATEPDAVLAQELSPDQASVIEARLPHGLLLPRRDMHGMGLALRRPATVAILQLPRRPALVARLSPADWHSLPEPLEIINVHMSAPTRLGRLALRRGQLAGLQRHLATSQSRRVLAGDLNSFRLMPAYRALRAHLDDAALAGHTLGRPTWSPRACWPRLLRIDHVLTCGVDVVDLEVVRIRGSDHSAVLATLSISDTAPALRGGACAAVATAPPARI